MMRAPGVRHDGMAPQLQMIESRFNRVSPTADAEAIPELNPGLDHCWTVDLKSRAVEQSGCAPICIGATRRVAVLKVEGCATPLPNDRSSHMLFELRHWQEAFC